MNLFDFFAALSADANLSPAFRCAMSTQPSLLEQQHAKQQLRRFLAEPEAPSAFAALEAELKLIDRRNETGDVEAHKRDERNEQLERGE